MHTVQWPRDRSQGPPPLPTAHPREGTSDLQPSAPPPPLRLTDPQQESSRLKVVMHLQIQYFFYFFSFFFFYGGICPHLHYSSFQKSSKVLMVSKRTVDEFREADAIPLQPSTLQTPTDFLDEGNRIHL